MLRCGAARCSLPQQPPCLRVTPRRAPPPQLRVTRSSAPCRLASYRRQRLALPTHAAADDEKSTASPAPPSPPPAASPAPSPPLWAVPWDGGVTFTVCARFAFLWFAIGFAGPSLCQQLAGAALAPDARAEVELALGLFKAAASYQLARLVLFASRSAAADASLQLSSRLAPFAPLPPPWFAVRLEPRALALGAAGAVGAVAAAQATTVALGAVAALLPADAGAGGAFFKQLITQSDAGMFGAGALSACALTLLVSPPLEEAFFRGFLLPVLAQAVPPAAAVAASAAVFAVAHLETLLGTAQLFAVGAVLGATTLAARGNLVAPILAHAGYNALSLAALAAVAAAHG